MSAADVLNEPANKAILSQPYGRFSDEEFARRRAALTRVLEAKGCDAILVCRRATRRHRVCWLTGWPTTTEAIVLFMPRERDILWVEHYNHVPNAGVIARDAEVAGPGARARHFPPRRCSGAA